MSGDSVDESTNARRAVWLIGLSSASALGYAALLWLSWQFGGETKNADKPTLAVLAIFGGLFIAYWAALWLAVRLPSSRWLVGGIFAAACLFRGLMLPSIPMHEIDIYRYVWDGAVLADGVSPYRFSPELVCNAVEAGGVDHDDTLQRLVELQATSQSLSDSLHAIHYGQYPSPYPMVSQFVFAISAKLTPDVVSLHARVVIMKALLVLMDLATLVVVILLVRDTRLHAGWSLAYGWCPLVMKEIANGGHLDSIAIFLTTLAFWLLVKALRTGAAQNLRVGLSGVALALAIGAKLYPVVLVPLFGALWLRQIGWKAAFVGTLTTSLVTGFLLYPLLVPGKILRVASQELIADTPLNDIGQLNEPSAGTENSVAPNDGIAAFLDHWEMNDLLFMVVLENLRQQDGISPAEKPWFVVISDAWSRRVVTAWLRLGQILGGENADVDNAKPLSRDQLKSASFSLARVLTGGTFALVACLLAWLAAAKADPRAWCRAAMLTLAWFWLTCPTQNPWYWCWVLPLLPFARYRTWYAVAAMTMLYYLRFWLTAHYPDSPVLSTPYSGAFFFYFVVAWIEFVPVLLGLAVEWLLNRVRTGATVTSPDS